MGKNRRRRHRAGTLRRGKIAQWFGR